VWPVGSLINLNASRKYGTLKSFNQSLHFRWNRWRNECGDLRARPKFEAIEAQPERLDGDRLLRLVQFINTVYGEVANVGQGDVPVASFDGLTFHEFCNRTDEIAHAITLPVIRPQREK
jgi:hypothetical protein